MLFQVSALTGRRIAPTRELRASDSFLSPPAIEVESPTVFGADMSHADRAAAVKLTSTNHGNGADGFEDHAMACISHELRAPLVLLRDRLQAMLTVMEGEHATASVGELTQSLSHIERMERLVEKLRDLSIAEAEGARLAARRSDLVAFVHESVQPFSLLAERRQIALCLDVPASPILAYFDEEKLQIVVANLVDNALKYTPKGGQVRVKLDRELAHGSMQARLRVTDSGKGIPVDQLESIFERFDRGNARPNGSLSNGMGLGLALVRALVTMHGGRVEIESNQGNGTNVTVWLPLNRDHLSDDEIVEDVNPWTHERPSGGDGQEELPEPMEKSDDPADRPHVLVVDDNESLCRYLARDLERDYDVTWACNAAAGFDRARYARPDIILCDIMMPGEDGLSLLRRIKADEELRAIPVLILTAVSDDQFRLAGLRAQADGYLVKPMVMDELRLHLRNLVQKRRAISARISVVKSDADIDISPSAPDPESNDTAFVAKARAVVLQQIKAEDFDVQQLADALFVSRRVLERRMKAITAMSPNRYIRRLRLERAQELIENRSVRTVAEVAQAVGFRDASYFSRLFRSKEGRYPSALLHDDS